MELENGYIWKVREKGYMGTARQPTLEMKACQTLRPYLLEVSMTISSFIRLCLGFSENKNRKSSDFFWQKPWTSWESKYRELEEMYIISILSIPTGSQHDSSMNHVMMIFSFAGEVVKFFLCSIMTLIGTFTMSEVLSKRLVGDFFVVRDLSDWTTVKLTLKLRYKAIQLPVATCKSRSFGWFVGAQPMSCFWWGVRLVGKLQHETPKCGTRKESQSVPTFFACLLVEALGLLDLTVYRRNPC